MRLLADYWLKQPLNGEVARVALVAVDKVTRKLATGECKGRTLGRAIAAKILEAGVTV